MTGQVVLDGPQLAELLATPGGEVAVRVPVLHELAHLVGLGHVEDAGQVMHPGGASAGPSTFADSDLRGLALLGAGGCR